MRLRNFPLQTLAFQFLELHAMNSSHYIKPMLEPKQWALPSSKPPIMESTQEIRPWSDNQISALFQKLTLDHKDGDISQDLINEEDNIIAHCKFLVDEYKNRGCKVPKAEFDAMVATIANFFNATSPRMSALRLSLAKRLDDVMSATYARLLEAEGKLVGCNWRELLEAVDGLRRIIVPADVDGVRDFAGQCFICREELGKEGSAVRVTDCGCSCHSLCLLQWHGENAFCPNFCGSELQRQRFE